LRKNAQDVGLSSMNKYVIPSVAEIKLQATKVEPKFEVVSFFAGGGGSSTGYRMAGGKVLAINEFIPEAIETYQSNWPDTIVFPGDVRKLTVEEVLEKINKQKGDLDLLDGSPPCSAFSTAGSREKGWNKTKKYSDAKQANVEDLFFEYIRILRGVMPKVFVAENVAGLTKGVAKGYLNEILRELRASGYQVACQILDARWLGVPQSRARAIFIGVRNDLWISNYEEKLHPKPFKNIITLENAFDGLDLSQQDKIDTDISKYSIYKLLKEMPRGTAHVRRFGLQKAHPERYSPCILATNGNRGAASAVHWDNRAFTVAEVKRIMSVPDDYILTGTYQQKIERLGRMVAPLMMKAVADNLCSLGVFDARHT
jgi:DNA (cytosine-5)-methyltransferase 1